MKGPICQNCQQIFITLNRNLKPDLANCDSKTPKIDAEKAYSSIFLFEFLFEKVKLKLYFKIPDLKLGSKSNFNQLSSKTSDHMHFPRTSIFFSKFENFNWLFLNIHFYSRCIYFFIPLNIIF